MGKLGRGEAGVHSTYSVKPHGGREEAIDRRSRKCYTTYVVWLCGLWAGAPKVVYCIVV